eukprot:c20313_g1_i2 orf=470-1486(-)
MAKDRTSSDSEERQVSESSNNDKTSDVLHWSVDQVRLWLEQNVPLDDCRLQECLHAFQNERIDGLSLLTLQRNHCACSRISDSEWSLLKAARKKLLAINDRADVASSDTLDPNNHLGSSFWTPPTTPEKETSDLSLPCSPQHIRLGPEVSATSLQSSSSILSSSPQRLLSFPKLTSDSETSKDEQIALLVSEVQSLRGEVVHAEEHELTLQSQLDHLDEVLRTAILAGYMYTRRWSRPLPDQGPAEVTDNDWLQRFVVLQGTSIFFYLRATDLRPQGTILLSEIIDAGPMTAFMHNQEDSQLWYTFHISTCHGIRLECATPLKPQMDSWLTSVRDKFI